MKIENGYSRHLQNIKQSQDQSKSRQTQSKEENFSKEPGVSVEISAEAQALLKADQSAHTSRVEEIKAQIENGTYDIDTDAISNGLLSTIQSQKEN